MGYYQFSVLPIFSPNQSFENLNFFFMKTANIPLYVIVKGASEVNN